MMWDEREAPFVCSIRLPDSWKDHYVEFETASGIRECIRSTHSDVYNATYLFAYLDAAPRGARIECSNGQTIEAHSWSTRRASSFYGALLRPKCSL